MKRLERPNVLILYTDQQRWDSLQCYGNELALTPNLDRLAERGARLDKFFVQNPVCTPSRMSMLTGRYCSSLGVGINGILLPDDALPIHQLLKPYGYHTAQIGKLHFTPHSRRDHRDPTSDHGFDTLILSDEPGCYDDAYVKWVESLAPEMVDKVRTGLPPAAAGHQPELDATPRKTHQPYFFRGGEEYTHSSFVASEMCQFIERHTSDKFFAIAGFYAPHSPVDPPERFAKMYDLDKMPLPKLGKDERFRPFLKDVPEEKWRQTVAYYLALVSHVDDCIGQIITTLERADLLDNTLIIFTTDHGEFLGDHGNVGKGMPGHDCITRVPCLISYPGTIAAGLVVDQLVEAVDLVPTILDFCGIQIPTAVQGKSLRDLLLGRSSKHRDDVLTEMFSPQGTCFTTVRTEKYKYHTNSKGREILYDLLLDPYELTNVVNEPDYKDVLSEMRLRMIHRIQQAAYVSGERIADY